MSLFAPSPEKKNDKMKKIWDNYRVIGEFKKSKATKVVVSLGARDGVKCINIRAWYLKKNCTEWSPAFEGIVVPLAGIVDEQLNQEIGQQFINLINQAMQEAPAFAIEDAANAVYVPKKEK